MRRPSLLLALLLAAGCAEGDASRFRQIYTEYAKAPEVTRQRMYLDTMQQIYANTSKVLVDAKGQGNLLYLPLDKLMQATAGVAMQQAPATAVVADPARVQRQPAGFSGDVPPQLDRGPESSATRDLRSRDREAR